jgi:hypothetical protein
MRTAGPSDSLFLVNSAGSSPGLRVGAVVFVTIREKLAPGLFRIAVANGSLVARAGGDFTLGSTFRARVERSSGGGTRLHVLPAREGQKGGLPEILARGGLSDDIAGRLAAAALLSEGMSPETRALARVRRLLLRRSGSSISAGDDSTDPLDAERRALAARMEAKGIPAEEEVFEAIAAESDGSAKDGRHERGKSDNKERSGDFTDIENGFVARVSETELPSVLGMLIRALAMRAGGEGSFLNLFNHFRGPEGSWIYVPFRFGLDSIDFSGQLRIKLPYLAGGAGRLEAGFSVRKEGQAADSVWAIALSFGGGAKPALRLSPGCEKTGNKTAGMLPILEGELTRFGCSVVLAPHADTEIFPVTGLDLDA